MNYILLLNEFHNRMQGESLSSSAQLTYYKLLAINNSCGWMEWFQRTNLSLCEMMGISKNTLKKAIADLVTAGLIEVKPGSRNGDKTKYKIINICESKESQNSNEQPSEPSEQPQVDYIGDEQSNVNTSEGNTENGHVLIPDICNSEEKESAQGSEYHPYPDSYTDEKESQGSECTLYIDPHMEEIDTQGSEYYPNADPCLDEKTLQGSVQGSKYYPNTDPIYKQNKTKQNKTITAAAVAKKVEEKKGKTETELSIPDSLRQFYESNISTISPLTAGKIQHWLEDVDVSLIEYAIEEAVDYGPRKWIYIERILRDQFNSGNKSRLDVENSKRKGDTSGSNKNDFRQDDNPYSDYEQL